MSPGLMCCARTGCWIAVFLFATPSVGRGAPPDRTPAAAAVVASNAFGFDLYARLKASQKNLICSPVSASIALTMAAAGARGETRREMAGALHLGATGDRQPHASFGSLLDALQKRDGQEGVALQVANRLWGQDGLAFKPALLNRLRATYGAPLETVDFVRQTEAARVTINHWAAVQTHDRILEVLQEGDVDGDTRLVLTNAVYFKGAWAVQFRKGETIDHAFAAPDGNIVTKMMRRRGNFRYARSRGVQIAELPYRGGLSMVVVLPDAADGLDAVEARLADGYQGWLKALDLELLDLELPRWTVSSHLSLAKPLAAMGMPAAFSSRADFSGMTDHERLCIDRVLQQAFVDVNEEGTEAAAVTAVVIRSISDVVDTRKPTVFHADHPFMYLIRDTNTGAILFIGRVVDPQARGPA